METKLSKDQIYALKKYLRFSSFDLDLAMKQYINVCLDNARDIKDAFILGNYTANLVYNKLILIDIIQSGRIDNTDVRVKDFLSFIDLMFDDRNLLLEVLNKTEEYIKNLDEERSIMYKLENSKFGGNLIGILSCSNFEKEDKLVNKLFKNYER